MNICFFAIDNMCIKYCVLYEIYNIIQTLGPSVCALVLRGISIGVIVCTCDREMADADQSPRQFSESSQNPAGSLYHVFNKLVSVINYTRSVINYTRSTNWYRCSNNLFAKSSLWFKLPFDYHRPYISPVLVTVAFH